MNFLVECAPIHDNTQNVSSIPFYPVSETREWRFLQALRCVLESLKEDLSVRPHVR